MNVIVGQNNVGKTALLQAIAQRFEDRPHRNSSQRRGVARNPISRIELEFIATGQDISDAMMVGHALNVNLPATWRNHPLKFLDLPEITISAAYQSGQGHGTGWAQSRYPSNNIIADDGQYLIFTLVPHSDRAKIDVGKRP
jgi:predicted ATP-dependent endonuclease of OLD family